MATEEIQPQKSEISIPPEPPRVTGDMQRDFPVLVQYLNDFYKKAVLEGYFASTIAASADVDPDSLPDPANTNLATAQQTANDAYIIGSTALAKTRNWIVGTLDVTETDTTAVFTFDDEQEDVDYRVIMTRAAESTPAIGATAVVSIAKTVADFTVTFNSAPGAGETVTWDFLVCRGQDEDG